MMREQAQQTIDLKLRNPLIATPFFGAVFFAAIVVSVFRRATIGEFDAEFIKLIFVWLIFAIGTGSLTSTIRHLFPRASFQTKNNLTGLAAGFTYAAACIYFFGTSMGFASCFAMGLFVSGGVAWAVSSALNEI